MSKIKVKPEGRKGVYTCEREDIIEWLEQSGIDTFHNYNGSSGPLMIGADWEKSEVIKEINKSDRIGILTGSALSNNLRHGLSVITGNKLEMFDIGEITDYDLDIGDNNE
jgi:hypothetical protein